jgi:hypothetical protein
VKNLLHQEEESDFLSSITVPESFTDEISEEKDVLNIKFSFEDFLEEVEEELPEGLDSNYYNLLPSLQKPLKNLKNLPRAFLTLPINAFLFQPLPQILKIYMIPVILTVPTLLLSLLASYSYGIEDYRSLSNGVLFFILASFGVIVTPIYIKNTYNTFTKLIDTNQAKWLMDPIQKPFAQNYYGKWPRLFLVVSFFIPFILELQILTSPLFFGQGLNLNPVILILSLIGLLIGHIGLTFVIYFNLMAIYFVKVNTSLYQKLLGKITERVDGYNDGHESLLTKNTYEVVKVLADTPGLSIQSLGNIPIYGFLASILIINGLIFLIGGPFLTFFIEDIATNAQDAAVAYNLLPEEERITAGILFKPPLDEYFNAKIQIFAVIFYIAIILSLILSFTQVIWPIISISRIMGKFKKKALSELDPFIYGEITNIALDKVKGATMETNTQVLFMLREYIYSMKQSPVNPFIFLQYSILSLIYFTRALPLLVKLFSGAYF